jgi:hypothetical protein
MKILLLGALVGLAIGFAQPTFAQQKEKVDPQLAQQIRVLGTKFDEMLVEDRIAQQLEALAKKLDQAINNNDAAAAAALFTEDGVFVTPQGPIYGREAIEKYYADGFKRIHYSNFINKNDQNSPHVIGTAGNEVWSNGEWGATI